MEDDRMGDRSRTEEGGLAGLPLLKALGEDLGEMGRLGTVEEDHLKDL